MKGFHGWKNSEGLPFNIVWAVF